MATFTYDEFLVYMTDLPKKFEKQAEEINEEMAKSLQRRVRTRAPTGFTGSLKKVEIRKDGENLVLTGPNHWFFVNAGMYPKKLIPIEAAEEHFQNPGSTAGKKLNIPNPKGWFLPGPSRKGKGFVDDSIKSLQTDIPRIIEMGINKALQK